MAMDLVLFPCSWFTWCGVAYWRAMSGYVVQSWIWRWTHHDGFWCYSKCFHGVYSLIFPISASHSLLFAGFWLQNGTALMTGLVFSWLHWEFMIWRAWMKTMMACASLVWVFGCLVLGPSRSYFQGLLEDKARIQKIQHGRVDPKWTLSIFLDFLKARP